MNDVFQVIEERKQVYLDWLVQICRQPSIAAQNRGMEETARLVERMLRDIGASTQQVATKGYPVVYGEIGGEGSKTLSFYDHYDVQPEDPLELWESDPFEPSIRDGTFYARGVSDNKGNIIARLAAVDAYVRARGKLPANVKFIFEGEEEIGSPNLGDFAEAHQDLIQADGCIW
jgi:acetylornithine deacetylase/succinyl-diaminopimelate desuccinylase-like protein